MTDIRVGVVPKLSSLVGPSMGAMVGGAVHDIVTTRSSDAINEAMARLTKVEKESTANQVLQECVESLTKENELLQARYDLLLGKYMELVDRVVGLLPPVKAHGNHEGEESTCPKAELL